MNRQERRIRAAMARETKYVKGYVEHLPERRDMDITSPGVHHVVVYHDTWCSIYRDGGCNCEPDIKYFTEPKRS